MMISSLLVTFIFCIFNLITCDSLSFRLVRKYLKSQGSKNQLMDFRPAWDVDRLILGKITFVLSVLL